MSREVAVNLHAHEGSASPDSQSSIPEMMMAYRRELTRQPMIGFVGHDDVGHSGIPRGETPCTAIKGVEHTIDKSIDLHVVEYPEHDFQFLAHPGYTWDEDVREKALNYVRNHDLDGVEKFRAGNVQYEGRLPVLELAGDDAHNPRQVGSSYMIVEVPVDDIREVSWSDIFTELKAGRMELVNDPKGTVDTFIGNAKKGLSMLQR